MSRIKGRYLVEGNLIFTSPLIIGSGESDYADIMLLRDDNGTPYIPATSLVGVLRHKFYNEVILSEMEREQAEYFWGSAKKSYDDSDSFQSSLYVSDLMPIDKINIQIRDGVEIDDKTGIAKDEQKFDYEIVEPGAVFRLKAEVLLRETFYSNVFLKIITYIIKNLNQGDVRIGAMTTKGFGRCKLIDYKVYHQNYSDKRDVLSWLSREKEERQKIKIDFDETFEVSKNDFHLDAKFAIKNSLIVRTYSGKTNDPDAVHISSNDKFVLPGTSVRGALRSRALRIINTLAGDKKMIDDLFGYVSKVRDSGDIGSKQHLNTQKSKIVVEETNVENVVQERQYRIRIDRFTGEVCRNALFDSKPLWPISGEDEMVTIKLMIEDYDDWEVGLILLLLKDLWTGDLPIGGEKSIGRGVLRGICANIQLPNKTYGIEQRNSRLEINGDKDELESFVQSFVRKCRERGEQVK